jgi:hypothetical protein
MTDFDGKVVASVDIKYLGFWPVSVNVNFTDGTTLFISSEDYNALNVGTKPPEQFHPLPAEWPQRR